ncbi:tagaturonate reductase [Neomoorella humiferrea]|uniref:Altronate oxidoreductase n=1 Tax=Neomoorella humiferrea TaxID=676965 RepID=A0A2T0ATA2_9FIRM|nr:tagaturonate reductase [Moorella humiferrea]PRR73586.1 Altronate oxidoreductase [Moorella humiferrea]
MRTLNKTLLTGQFSFPPNLEAGPYPDNLPERVLQFGEGNFLRAFVDWMIHQLNKKGLFQGRVVVVQPLAHGLVDQLNRQDGLYTLILRGYQDGQVVEKREIITSISRGINPYEDWQAVLRCAEDPQIDIVISNTTEAGIIYDPEDSITAAPPQSFPGKLTAYLYHRYNHFKGDPDKGMLILSCELIDRNGDNLKAITLRLAGEWGLPEGFQQWLKEANLFLNTLVDRVVPGYPREEAEQLARELGYEDALLDTGELFHLWVIEGPTHLKEKLPFHAAGLNVIWTDDLTPYRTRKVRILNGAHTATAALAFLSGVDTVREAVEHPRIGPFMEELIYNEVISVTDLDKRMLTEFAGEVLQRFRNPYIVHRWQSILLNTTSKYKTRVLPSLLDYAAKNKAVPAKLTFSLAAMAALFKDGRVNGRQFQGKGPQGDFIIEDDPGALAFWQAAWQQYQGTAESAQETAKYILGNSAIWGRDLNNVPGLAEKLGDYLQDIVSHGPAVALEKVLA